MSKENNWSKYIASIFSNLYTGMTFCSPSQVLIVEGKTDFRFYHGLLNNAYFTDDNGRKYKFNINNQNTIFGAKTAKGDSLIEDTYKIQDGGYNSDFVIEAIKYYQSNLDKFKHLYCFGIIDKDFGHAGITELNKEYFSKYQYHDRETTLLFYYLRTFISKYCIKSDESIQNITTAFRDCFEQGILEKASFIAEKRNNEDETLKCYVKKIQEVSKYYFDNNQNKSHFGLDCKIGDYLKNYKKYIKLNDIENKLIDSVLENFIKVYLETRDKYIQNGFEESFDTLIKKWILNEELDGKENKRISRIFDCCNGHYLLNQFIINEDKIYGFKIKNKFNELLDSNVIHYVCGDDLKKLESDEKLVCIIRDDIILKQNEFENFFEKNPLVEYKKIRKDKGLFVYK